MPFCLEDIHCLGGPNLGEVSTFLLTDIINFGRLWKNSKDTAVDIKMLYTCKNTYTNADQQWFKIYPESSFYICWLKIYLVTFANAHVWAKALPFTSILNV